MLNVTKPSENRVDVEFRGALDADGMRAGLDQLIALSEGMKNGRMYYTITDFTIPTLGALGVEMTRLPQMFGLLAKFDKCAVVSDSGFVRKAATVEGALFPGMQIKSFEFGEEAQAEAWLAEA